MDTLVSRTGLSSSLGEGVHFPDLCLLIVPYRGLWFCPVASSNLFIPPHIKAAADWLHWITNYNLWQLICFCSQLQMPWGKMSQSVRAHAHHIISDLLRKKIHQFLTAGVTGGKKTKQKTKQFHTFWLLLLCEGGKLFSYRCSAP